MLIDLPTEEFEEQVAKLMKRNRKVLAEEVVAGAEWLEWSVADHDDLRCNWEKLNNFTSLVCQMAAKFTK